MGRVLASPRRPMLAALAALTLVAGVAVPGTLAGASGIPGTATPRAAGAPAGTTHPAVVAVPGPATPPLPRLPALPLADTAGRPEAALYGQALALATVGRRDVGLQDAITRTQAALDTDAVLAARADRAARRARRAAVAALAAERVAGDNLRWLTAALRRGALALYVSGFGSTPPDPLSVANPSDVWDQDLFASALSPSGVVGERRAQLRLRRHQAAVAAAQWRLAASAARRAGAAARAERAAGRRLLAALEVVDARGAGALAADHVVLAAQAGRMLSGPGALQFAPKAPLPAPPSTTDVALTWAFAELGVPYLWGGTGAGGFDCSGLTQYVWGKAGVSIPRVAAAQYAWTDPVPLSQLTPGDLVFYGHGYIHHVGIYIGDGLMINAPYTGTVVQVSSIWWSDLVGFGRVHADGTPTASRQVPTPADAIRRVVRSTKPVPSESRPPPGWKPPKHVHHRASSPTSTPSTTAPSGTTAPPSTPTTAPPSTATTSTTSTTTAPSTTSSTQPPAGTPDPSSTTTSPASGSTGPGDGSGSSG